MLQRRVIVVCEGKELTPAAVRESADGIVFAYDCGLEAMGTRAAAGEGEVWSWRLRNAGRADSPPITAFHPLAAMLPCRGRHAPWLHGTMGGLDEALYPPTTWTAWSRTIATEGLCWQPVTAQSRDGRSSNDHAPLFILEECQRQGGWFLALGWSGDWSLWMTRQEETVSVRAGMTHLRLVLKPGESVLQPSVLAGRYRGGVTQGYQALRRCLRDHIQPRLAGKPMQPVAFWDNYYGDRGAFSEADLLEELPLAAQVGMDYFVVDGGWTGGGEDAQFQSLLPHIGSWRPDPRRFSNGFEPLRQAARRHKIRLGLWFDVEQAHPQSLAAVEHPELFAPPGGFFKLCLLQLEKAQAADWVFETIERNVVAAEAGWIRFDFNHANPAQTWAAADGPDRRGWTECRYIENLYSVLDRLRQRFPDLAIENCASGGRRIDLGTLQRGHTNWISDHSQCEAVIRYHIHGAARWLPANQINTSFAHVMLEPHRPVDWTRPLPASAYLSHFGGNFSVSDRLKRLGPAARAPIRRHVDLFRHTAGAFAGDVIVLGQQNRTFDGPSGLAALDPATGRRALLVFGDLAPLKPELPAPFVDLPEQQPVLSGDDGDAQFCPARIWADPD